MKVSPFGIYDSEKKMVVFSDEKFVHDLFALSSKLTLNIVRMSSRFSYGANRHIIIHFFRTLANISHTTLAILSSSTQI
jgi:hypothetical protein